MLPQHEEILGKLLNYIIELSSARCWSQILFSTCLPNLLACLHHRERSHRIAGLQCVRATWQAVLHAERTLADDETPAAIKLALKNIVAGMAWNVTQLSREIFAMGERADWGVDDYELRRLAFLMFAAPANTKHFLEDSLSHLSDVIKRFSRQHRMSKRLA